MSNDVIITVKVIGKEGEVNLDAIASKAKNAGEKITNNLVMSAQQAGPKLDALSRTLLSLKVPTLDLKVNPRSALKAIEETRIKLKELGKNASSTEVKMDVEKALNGLKKLEKGIGDVEEAVGFFEKIFSNISSVITSGIQTAASGAQAALSNLATGGIGLVTSALATLASLAPIVAAGFAALSASLLLVGGAAGAAATGLTAAGIGLATLAIGFGGIGAALSAHKKAMDGAGKAATDTAEQNYQSAKRIHDAERSLADAKMNEVDAAKAVNQARQDEITRLKELAITLEQQKASQADAAQALVEAKEKQRRANIAGSDWEKANANNAVADAQANYDAITQKLAETTAEKKKAAKVGVDGSDQVQAALKRERDAHEQTTRAIEALADAHHKSAVASAGAAGGVDLFNQAMQKLSPNAQKLVYALLDIEKRFDVIKRKVQDRLLDGFDKSVTDLADKWLPHLNDILGGTADHLNGFGKKLMTALGNKDFIKNIENAGKEGQKVIDKMSGGIPALIDAFGRLAGHSGPVLQVIFGTIEKIFEWFDKWIKSADKSGKLDSFMKMAADTLQTIFDIGGKVFKVIGQFIEIIFPSSKKTGDSIMATLSTDLDKISKWLSDPNNQKWIKAIADAIGEFISAVVKHALPAIATMLKAFGKFVGFVGDNIGAIAHFFKAMVNAGVNDWNWMINKFAGFLNWISKSASAIGRSLYGMWDWLKQGFRDVLNWVIDRWNSLSFSFPSFLGGGTVSLPHINHLAHGGVAGGLAEVGEHGRELVRLPQGSTVIPHGQSESMLSGHGSGGGQFMFAFERTGNKVMDAIIDSLRLYVKSRGGNVQVALGRGN